MDAGVVGVVERDDFGAGREEIDGGAVVGGERELVAARGVADGDDVVERVARGVEARDVHVGGGVAGGGDEDDAGVARGGERGELRIGKAGAAGLAVAGVDDVRAVADGVVHAAGDVGDGAAAGGGENFHGHDLDFPRDAGDGEAVVADGADGAGDVGAVAVVVGGAAGLGTVHEARAVGVAESRRRVAPEVGGDVLMVEVHAGIDDGDDDVGRIVNEIPRGGGLDVGPGDAGGLAGVFHRPERAVEELGIVGLGGNVADVIGLDELVAAGGAEARERGGGGVGVVEVDDTEVAEARDFLAHAHAVARFLGIGGRQTGGVRPGENHVFAEALGEFLGREGRVGRGGGAGEGKRAEEGKKKAKGKTREAHGSGEWRTLERGRGVTSAVGRSAFFAAWPTRRTKRRGSATPPYILKEERECVRPTGVRKLPRWRRRWSRSHR